MGCGVSSQEVDYRNNNGGQGPPPTSRPLVKSPNYRHGSNITQAEINNQRNEFWATRTSGNTTMWQAIHGAADALLADDLPLASAILEASNIVSATGSLELCYDERGHRYKVPQYCYSHPVELRVNDPAASHVATRSPSPSSSASNPNSQPINLHVRISPGDKNVTIKITTGEFVSDLKRCIAEQTAPTKSEDVDPATDTKVDPSKWTCPPSRQRIMLLGRELKDPQRLSDLGLDERKVVQVFLRAA